MPQEIRLPQLTEEEALGRIIKWLRSPRRRDPYSIGSPDYGHELYIPHVIDQLFKEMVDEDRRRHPVGMRQYYMEPHQEGASVFYDAAWVLCQKGILRPNPPNPNANGVDIHKGFTVTSYGKKWLSQVQGDESVAAKQLLSEERGVLTEVDGGEVKSQSSIPTLQKDSGEGAGSEDFHASTVQNVDEQHLLNNRYRILSQLPTGGFGKTFLAEDMYLPSRRKCVIKQLTFSGSQETYRLILERFEREAVILEKLAESSEQIPKLYAHFSEEGQFYLVQEYVAGNTIASMIATDGLFTETTAKSVLESILRVLDYVHAHNIIHRDIKPENIILRENDSRPFLIDFGAVKEIVRTMVDPFGNPTTTIVIGTHGYMPTEQAAGRPVFASDIYSLGLTTIYMLTGKRPQELTDLRTGDISWRGNLEEVGAEFASILDKATRTDFRERFSTAREMLDALLGTSQPTDVEPQGHITDPEPIEKELSLSSSKSISSASEETSRRTNVDYINRAQRAGAIYPIAEELLQHIKELQAAIKQSGRGGETDTSLSEEINHLQGELNGLYRLSEGDIASHMYLREAQNVLLELRGTPSPIEASVTDNENADDDDSEYSLALEAAREVRITNKQRQWRTSEEGVSSARQEFNTLYEALERRVKKTSERLAADEAPIKIDLSRESDNHFILSSESYNISFTWDCKSDTTLEGSVLSIRGYKKGLEEKQYYTADYDIELNRDLVVGWRQRQQRDRFISTDNLAKEFFWYLLTHIRNKAIYDE